MQLFTAWQGALLVLDHVSVQRHALASAAGLHCCTITKRSDRITDRAALNRPADTIRCSWFWHVSVARLNVDREFWVGLFRNYISPMVQDRLCSACTISYTIASQLPWIDSAPRDRNRPHWELFISLLRWLGFQVNWFWSGSWLNLTAFIREGNMKNHSSLKFGWLFPMEWDCITAWEVKQISSTLPREQPSWIRENKQKMG